MKQGTAKGLQVQLSHQKVPFDGGLAYGSRIAPKRLVIFVHGCRGSARRTWNAFILRIHKVSPRDLWWSESDLLFLDLSLTRRSIVSQASRLRKTIEQRFPERHGSLLAEGVEAGAKYDHLILVGHSAGGLVIRQAILDLLQPTIADHRPDATCSALSNIPAHAAKLRLFAPALAGRRLAGWKGFLSRFHFCETIIDALEGYNIPIHDLREDSMVVNRARDLTEDSFRQCIERNCDEVKAFRAHILWAEQDDIVGDDRYACDLQDTERYKNHGSVHCPSEEYDRPLRFAKEGL